MAEGPGRGNPPSLRGIGDWLTNCRSRPPRGAGRVRLNEKRFMSKVVIAPRGARSNASLAAFAFFAQPDRMRVPKEERKRGKSCRRDLR